MKLQLSSLLLAVSAFLFTSCGEGSNTGSADSKDSSTINESSKSTNASTEGNNASTTGPIKEVIDHYLHVKNALADDNGTEAANGAKALVASLQKVDASKFTADQKKVYDDVSADLKEMAEHTADNANNIAHQREHFVMMSDDVHELIKGFGTDKTLYQDHCPMANNNKGAIWISEVEEIRNPYMGKKMPKCGTVEKVIKN